MQKSLISITVIMLLLPQTSFGASFDNSSIVQLFTYNGNVLPSANGWRIQAYDEYEFTGARVEDGFLHFEDDSTDSGSAIHYTREWTATSGYLNVAEFVVKVVSISGDPELGVPLGYAAIYIGTSDGKHNMIYTLYPDRILSSYRNNLGFPIIGQTYYYDTTAQFNTYKAVIDNGIAKLYINGKLVLEQPVGIGIYNVNGVEFGAGSSPATGEAYFDEVRVYQQPVSYSESSSITSASQTQDTNKEEAKISVAIKQTKKLTLIAVKNSDENPVFEVQVKILDGSIKFVKAKGWDRDKINSSTVSLTTNNSPILPNKSLVIIVLSDNRNASYELNAFGKSNQQVTTTPSTESSTTKKTSLDLSCKGHAACFTATVTAIVDGDTVDVNDGVNTIRIRLALTNTPERGQPLYNQAVQFTANLCSVSSIAGIDEDDGQREGSYGRMIAKVYCQNKILNAELLDASLATIDTRFCNDSEFASEWWAQQYGCKQTVQQTQSPSVTPTPSPSPPKETEKNCDPSYPDVCIPPPPPDLDCKEIPYRNFRVLPPDPHGFDHDKDGIGCET